MSRQKPLLARHLLAYSIPSLATAVMQIPFSYVIPAYYAKHTSVGLAAIGTVLLLGRVFDAVSDPLIGYMSDRTSTRLGARKPWMIAGTPIAMIAVWFVFVPPETATMTYFMISVLVMFVGWTLIEIPYWAWGVELSHDYDQRSRIMNYKQMAAMIGAFMFMASPILLSPITGSTEIGGETLKFVAIGFIVLIPFLMALTVIAAPTGKPLNTSKYKLRDLYGIVKGSRPFQHYVAAVTIGGVGNGMFYALILIVMDSYFGLAHLFPVFLLAAWGSRILFMPVWLKLIYRYGKHRVWAFVAVVTAVMMPGILLAKLGGSALIISTVFAAIMGAVEGGKMVPPASIMGDIADYDTLKTGSNRAATYFAIYGLISKFNLAVGGAVAFYIIALFDYQVDGENGAWQVGGLMLAFLVIPGVLQIIEAVIIWRFPITKHKHEVIRRRLEQRAARKLRATA